MYIAPANYQKLNKMNANFFNIRMNLVLGYMKTFVFAQAVIISESRDIFLHDG